jgi:hypothetical protein
MTDESEDTLARRALAHLREHGCAGSGYPHVSHTCEWQKPSQRLLLAVQRESDERWFRDHHHPTPDERIH